MNQKEKSAFDLVIIGGGPAGYVGAIRAGQLGMKTALIDKRANLGGTCLNVGCIPSKFLLQASQSYAEISNGSLEVLGIKTAPPKLDLKQMLAQKGKVVDGLVKGIDMLVKKNKVEKFTGTAKFLAKNADGTISVEVAGKTITAGKVIIATGSRPKLPPKSFGKLTFNDKNIISSTEALELTKVPKVLLVVGAGVIGLEIGSFWSRLGSKVIIFEAFGQILPGMDASSARKCQKLFEKQGIEFVLNAKITAANSDVKVSLEGSKSYKGDKLLIATGRDPVTEELGLDKIGIAPEKNGFIKVDPKTYATNVEGVFAVGDVIGGMMLAHKASDEAVALVEQLSGIKAKINYNAIPGVVYTHPEIASVGMNELKLKEQKIDYIVGNFSLMANSRARTQVSSEGWVRIFADKQTKCILGGEVVANNAGEIIHEITLAIEFSACLEDLAITSHSHPTLSEAVREAALNATSGAIHS